jgi:hypothetical protein
MKKQEKKQDPGEANTTAARAPSVGTTSRFKKSFSKNNASWKVTVYDHRYLF